jgi:dTDP-4-dehydrorhamnose reductase
MKKVLILGSSGMLGSMVTDYLVKHSDFEISAALRNLKLKEEIASLSKIKCIPFDADSLSSLKELNPAGYDWIINAAGIIKPYIKDDRPETVERALKVNSLFPHALAEETKNTNTKVIQIATDCAFSGQKGRYDENSSHDALDAYGKTKSLGEAVSENFYNLRCSIIGPELKNKLSFLEWFLGQKQNAVITGFKNHFWNGVTTLHFAKICKGIMENELKIPSKQHIVPEDVMTKTQMLGEFAKYYKRTDIQIKNADAPSAVDRTLSTINPETNLKIWKSAGYDTPPSIGTMIKELSEYNYNH